MIVFRVFPHPEGGWDVDLVGTPTEEEIGKPPFRSPGEARRAVRTIQNAMKTGRIVVLEARPDDAHEQGL